jgi:pyrimidine-nucleoside phosphorylase
VKDLIGRKRDGQALTRDEIARWIRGVTDGTVPEYQSAALLMAIVLRGMDAAEGLALSEAMLHSGRVLRWDGLGRPTVDKHSTGGVGDKVSIALAPWVAACGAAVPMLAGRGLGHTGGSVDKLEAVPGFRAALTLEEFEGQVRRLGVAIAAQTRDLAPADAVLYPLRDATSTVESRPLIVASILSKKLAAGSSGIIFDVKCGTGAFMRTLEEARLLAADLVATARALGAKARALITAMDEPLGGAIGNANETAEALAVLRGEAPRDVADLTLRLGVEMLTLSGVAREPHEAEARLRLALESGRAVERAGAMIQAQGGDPRVVSDPDRLPRAEVETPVPSPRAGFVGSIDATGLGRLLIEMGGGRREREDRLDHAVGIRLLHKVGEPVREGEALAILESHREARNWAATIQAAFTIQEAPPPTRPLILEAVS